MWILSQDSWSPIDRLRSDPDLHGDRSTENLAKVNQNINEFISTLADMIYNHWTLMNPKVYSNADD
jgi:hypothetical protein